MHFRRPISKIILLLLLLSLLLLLLLLLLLSIKFFNLKKVLFGSDNVVNVIPPPTGYQASSCHAQGQQRSKREKTEASSGCFSV